jgi:ABC-type nitrate/sulfonate/bicarbonate transport system substrate-binding protein
MYDRLVRSVKGGNLGPWAAHEDLLLLRAVRSHGTKWADIEALRLVPGRSARQMKERFATTLDPAIDHSPLNAEVQQSEHVEISFDGGHVYVYAYCCCVWFAGGANKAAFHDTWHEQ